VVELTLTVSPEVAQGLAEVAARLGLTAEQVAERLLTDNVPLLRQQSTDPAREAAFRAAVASTLTKNAELYRRLAD
jgi:hypothetical protein